MYRKGNKGLDFYIRIANIMRLHYLKGYLLFDGKLVEKCIFIDVKISFSINGKYYDECLGTYNGGDVMEDGADVENDDVDDGDVRAPKYEDGD